MTIPALTSQESIAESNQPVMDYALAISRVGGDAELLKELGILFLEEYPRLLEQLRDAYQQREASQLERAAHSLKGSVANFGAKEAVEIAAKIEQAGARGDLPLVDEMLPALELVLLSLHGELARL